MIGVVNLDKAAFLPTGLATALAAKAATQAAKRHEEHQKRERAFEAAENKRKRVLVSFWMPHTLHACHLLCRLTSATLQERLYDGNHCQAMYSEYVTQCIVGR